MGKKKLSLKPVNRGFATTSVQSKKQKEQEVAPADEEVGETSTAGKSVEGVGGSGGDSEGTSATSRAIAVPTALDDWENEENAEDAVLQGYVDRLQDKGDKEVARVIKAIEYDRRIATGYTSLNLDPDVRDQVLSLVTSEQDSTAVDIETSASDTLSSSVKPLKRPASHTEQEKLLLRIFITHHVLSRLGFTDVRIRECLVKGLQEGEGWEEALEWMWLHLSEDECLQRGIFAPQEEKLDFDEALLAPAAAPEPTPPPMQSVAPSTDLPTPSTAETNSHITTTKPTSLFQALSASGSTSSESESDDEVDLGSEKTNRQWADLMLQLDGLRIAGGAVAKGKGKKKGSGVVMETPEMRKVMDMMKKVEKEYLFSRKDADAIFRTLKADRDAQAIEAKLRDKGAGPLAGHHERANGIHDDVEEKETSQEDALEVSSEDGDSEAGGLFGNMLDEPEPSFTRAVEPDSGNTNITVRSMPIPKQTAYSGTTPKALLGTMVTKSFKSAVILFVLLSGGSRAARSGLEIRFSDTHRRVWKMDDIACDDQTQAENYIATLALHDLSNKGDIGQVTWRGFPPDYRTLWDELDEQWKVQEDTKRRDTWRRIKEIYDIKVENAGQVGSAQTKTQTTEQISNVSTPTASRPEFIERLQTDYERRLASPAYVKMRPQRDSLPIASFRQQILDTIDQNQVMVLSGETGCGKSTQLPAYILEDQLSKGKPCKIYVTEPRRISAISLAQRVSVELGDAPGQMGTPSSLVGYSIRLEAKTSPQTRLAFVTNGIALRMLESGSAPGKGTAFDEVTHIVVDEVHERSIDSDFLLIVLRSLMQQRPDLKVILMSATLDAEKISGYFDGCPYLAVPGRTFPVQVNYLEDAVQVADWHIDETSPYAVRSRNIRPGKQLQWTEETPQNSDSDEEDVKQDPTALSSARYSAKTVSTVNLLDSRQIPYDLIVRLLERICFEDESFKSFSAATLVFMPGLAEIRKLNDALLGHPVFGSQDFMVYPLHSTVSSEGQQAVFDIPPRGVRKIVISTNIAETGVTIPDITCVIDTGKQREMRYDEKRQISRLIETYIARSNAKQRRGRAGRVQEGLAFHLFTRARHNAQLAEHPIPEMLRLSLQDLALRIKILRINLGPTVESVLLKALDPPTSLNIQRAIASLVEVKALTVGEDITPMGKLLSKLPMDVHLGKFLLVAAMMKCLDPALTIAATLNGKSPFVTPFGMEGAADTAKKGFAAGHSDFQTIVNAFNSWRRASDNPSFIRTFCRKHFLSHQNLQQIEELRQQLLSYLVDSGFIAVSPEQKREISQARYSRGARTKFVTIPSELNTNAETPELLNASLVAGLYPKVLAIDPSGGLKTIINSQPVSVHPSSVNFKKRAAQFESNYLTYFTIMQSKKLYAWEVAPVDDKALVMLCGDIVDFKPAAGSFQLDRRIRYSLLPKSGIAIKLLRQQFASALNTRLKGKKWSAEQERWFELGVRYLMGGSGGQGEQVGIVTKS